MTNTSTVSIASPEPVRRRGRIGSQFVRRVAGRPVAAACLLYLALIVLIAIVAPVLLPGVDSELAGDISGALQGPSGEHVLGTYSLGRDVLLRLLVGTRVTLSAVLIALVVGLAISVPVGIIAGYYRGRVDRIVGRVVELGQALPGIVILLVVLTVFPNNTVAAMVAFGVIFSPSCIRIVRSAVLPVSEELYVDAAAVSGLTRPYIMFRHILPRVAGPIIISGALLAAAALLAQAGLAFLGLLAQPPAPSWGGMLNDGVQNIVVDAWLILPPGTAIALTTVAFGLLGDEVRDATAAVWQPPPRVHRHRPLAAVSEEPPHTSFRSHGSALLQLRRVSVDLPTRHGTVRVVSDASFDVFAGETLGLVGESGCGKTMTAMAILGLAAGGGMVSGGSIVFDGEELTQLPLKDLRRLRGRSIGLISQEPMVALNPAFTVGRQIEDCLRTHRRMSRRAARAAAIELLASVQLPDPEAVAQRYPHQLSGGMAQRVAIARALSGEPKLLIADEPTTALDVTVQAEILDLLRRLALDRGMAVLLVTHDWGVVADICDRTVVMYAGEVVERAPTPDIFSSPRHPYTRALLEANPHQAPEGSLLATIPGVVPAPGDWPIGCRFQFRCPFVTDDCRQMPVPLLQLDRQRQTRCINYEEVPAR